MRGFRYKYGDRPLEGYTIQRAAGRGGFGEVYYAVSDSGREVALKVVQGYEQIELRGVGQCMNLKSPHLVTIFDVRHNDEGVPFVIMEFVSGPSLRQLLDESPSGLGMQKTAFFLREIGKGLAFLHECGIVHRDLKPGNIFYENGYVKIGDYGLSKAMSTSQHSGQTITVGTVHYMAPEISMGKYDRSIDIYAMGAMLFEMLTGQVPYLGASPGEILMKHMTAEPDVSAIEEPFATVIKKAMHRDPAQRYASVQEMIEAVFGAEHVQQSVSCFSPESLSMVAQRVAQRVAVGGGSATPPPLPPKQRSGPAVGDRIADVADRFSQRMGQLGDRFGDRMASLGHAMGGAFAGQPRPAQPDALQDPLSANHRGLLALGVMAVLAIVMAVLGSGTRMDGLSAAIMTFAAVGGAAAGVRLAQKRVLPQMASEAPALQRLAMTGIAVALMMAVCSPIYMAASGAVRGHLVASALAVLAPLLLLDWMAVASPGRKERVTFGHAIAAGAMGLVVGLIFGASPVSLAIAIAAGTSLVVQIGSPWTPAVTPAQRDRARALQAAGAPLAIPLGDPTGTTQTLVPAAPAPQPYNRPSAPPPLPRILPGRPIPTWARMTWLLLVPALFSLGVMLLVIPGLESHIASFDFAMFVAWGIGSLLLAATCLHKSLQPRFLGWWAYLVRPLLTWACAQSILVAAMLLGMENMRGEEAAVAVFFIVFPAVLMLVMRFVRFGRHGVQLATTTPEPASPTAGPCPAVPTWARGAWLLISPLLVALGIALLVVPGMDNVRGLDFAMFVAWGIGAIALGLLCFFKSFQVRFPGWWAYLFRPLLIWAGAQSILVSAMVMGSTTLASEEEAIAIFFIIFPVVLLPILLFVRFRQQPAIEPAPIMPPQPPMPGGWPDMPQPMPPAAPPAGLLEPTSPSASTSIAPLDPRPMPVRVATGLLGFLAFLLLLGSLVFGLTVAIDLPGMLAAGLPDPSIATGISQDAQRAGIEDWPRLMTTLLKIATGLTLLVAATLMMVARRWDGPAHIFRAPLGIAILGICLITLSAGLQGSWSTFAGRPMPGALAGYLQQAAPAAVIAAVVFLVASIIVLNWPPRRHTRANSAFQGA